MTDHSLPDRTNGIIPRPVSPGHPSTNNSTAFDIDTPSASSSRYVRALRPIVAANWVMGCCLLEDMKRYLGEHYGAITRASKIKVLVRTGGFIIACLGLWAAISAMKDGRKARKIAEWTAKKDFIEYCQATEHLDAGCTKAQDLPLGPPPISWIKLKARMLQQIVRQKAETFPGSALVLLGFPLTVTLWVSLRITLRRVFRRRVRYITPEQQQRPVGLLITTRENPTRVATTADAESPGVELGQLSMNSQSKATRRLKNNLYKCCWCGEEFNLDTSDGCLNPNCYHTMKCSDCTKV